MSGKSRTLYLLRVVILLIGVLGVALVVSAQGDGLETSPPRLQTTDDEDPDKIPTVWLPERNRPGRSSQAVNADHVEVVYFTPQDSNDTNTLLFLYNTSPVTGTVGLHTASLTGTQLLSTSLVIPP